MRIAERVFRLAMSAFPPAFSRKHAEEMAATFAEEIERVRRERGHFGAVAYALRASVDVWLQGARERIRRSPAAGHGARRIPARGRMGSGIGADVRLAFRTMKGSPGFTLAAVAVLALGIGANTTVFSALRVVILTPPPYPELERLVFAYLTEEHLARGERRLTSWSYPKFQRLREAENRMIDLVAAYSSRSASLTGLGPATRVSFELVSPPYFRLLGAEPVLGRAFTAEEDDPSDPPLVAVISQELWRSRFGGDAGAVGSEVTLGSTRLRVVGVAPEGFRGLGGEARLWVPMATADAVLSYAISMLETAGNHWLNVVGRVRQGVTIEQVRAQMTSIGGAIHEAYPTDDPQEVRSATARPFVEVSVNEGARAAVVLLAVGALVVLLAACANLSGLLLARARRKARDGAVRIAVGASRWRVVRVSLVESLALSAVGGAAGVALALWGTRAMRAAWPSAFLSSARGEVQVTDLSRLAIEPAVLLFALLATLLTALVFGAAPAVRLSGADVSSTLKDGTGSTRRERSVLGVDGRGALVGAQIALALILLVGAGLVGTSTARLLEVDEGFVADRLLTFRYAMPPTSAERRGAFHEELLARVAALPRVESVATGTQPLGGYSFCTRLRGIEGRPEIPQGEGRLICGHMVSDAYFETLGVPLVRGRLLDARDGTDRLPTVVISESAARELFPGEDPVGRRIEIGISEEGREALSEIVGVVGDVLREPADHEAEPEAYYSHREYGMITAAVLVRTSVDPTLLTPEIRSIVAELDPSTAVYDVTTGDRLLAASMGDRRIVLVLLGLFAGVAVVLAATGTWGVVAVSVAERRRELGLRMALGADGGRVLRMVVRRSILIAVAGVALGLLAGAALSRLLETFLWRTEAQDPAVYGFSAALLAMVVVVASCVPARRALRMDPADALRRE